MLEHATEAGFRVSERSLELSDLRQADNVFLTNSLRLMVPVLSINAAEFRAELPNELAALMKQLIAGTAAIRNQ
mgnify:FL=1